MITVNCFWEKPDIFHNHEELIFKEYMIVGEMLQSIGKVFNILCLSLDNVPNLYKQYDSTSSRGKGISIIIKCIKLLNSEFDKLSKEINLIATKIVEKKLSYDGKKDLIKMCDKTYKSYQSELNRLNSLKKIYFYAINKTIEFF